jgi:hypothetical protein
MPALSVLLLLLLLPPPLPPVPNLLCHLTLLLADKWARPRPPASPPQT